MYSRPRRTVEESERVAITAMLVDQQTTPLRTVALQNDRSLSLIRLEYDRLRREGQIATRPVGRPRASGLNPAPVR